MRAAQHAVRSSAVSDSVSVSVVPVSADGWSFERLLTSAEVAVLFGVHVKTVRKLAGQGHLAYLVTAGGHRRYSRQQVEHVLVGWPVKDYLTTGQIAVLFGVHPDTVTRWAVEGRLPSMRLFGTGTRRFPRQVVERFGVERFGEQLAEMPGAGAERVGAGS